MFKINKSGILKGLIPINIFLLLLIFSSCRVIENRNSITVKGDDCIRNNRAPVSFKVRKEKGWEILDMKSPEISELNYLEMFKDNIDGKHVKAIYFGYLKDGYRENKSAIEGTILQFRKSAEKIYRVSSEPYESEYIKLKKAEAFSLIYKINNDGILLHDFEEGEFVFRVLFVLNPRPGNGLLVVVFEKYPNRSGIDLKKFTKASESQKIINSIEFLKEKK